MCASRRRRATPSPPPLPQSAATKGVTLEVALGMLAFPKELGQNPATGGGHPLP